MGYAAIHSIAGNPAMGDLFTPTTDALFDIGTVLDAVDPYFGYGRFMYGKAVAAQVHGELVTWDESYVFTAMASTANLGYPLAVAAQKIAINCYGWYQVEGVCPVAASASVATGVAVGIGTAGKVGTNSAGKQILGAKVLQASTFALTKANAITYNGQPFIDVPSVDGLFVGLTLSGTGVGAGTITAIDAGSRRITNSANSTASGSITLTGTYTGYVLMALLHPNSQGAIT